MNVNEDKHEGACFCGQVRLEVTGKAVVSGYCHCHSCRKWHAAPINAWTLWPSDAVQIIAGEDKVHAFNLQGEGGTSTRLSCTSCGGAVANMKPQLSMTIVYAMTLADSSYKFEPALHIFYAERVEDMSDSLPKFVDVPTEYGGSGELIE